VVAAAADALGGIAGRAEVPLPRRGDQIEPLVKAIAQALKAADAPRRLLAAVGVSVPGMVDHSTGVCLLAPHIGWRDVPVRSELSKRLGVPVFPMNDTQAAVVAEAEAGAARGAADVVLYMLDWGVGAGVLIGGHILHGRDGMAGEIGHCRLPGHSDLCACGKRGCLETVASTDSIARAAHARTWAGLVRSFGGAEPVALMAVDRAVDAAGTAGSWLINLYNPEVLILAGRVPDLDPRLRARITDSILANALPAHRTRVRITKPGLGDESMLRGALLLARQRTTEHYRLVFGAVV
jgi:predicted NBD/HSP70 family sugar kinase